jgi:hypothetical protein
MLRRLLTREGGERRRQARWRVSPRPALSSRSQRTTAGAPRKRPTLARGAFWAGQAGAEGAGQGRNSTQNLRMAFGEFEKCAVLLKNPRRPTLPSGEGGFN